jgi:hypothetical protein
MKNRHKSEKEIIEIIKESCKVPNLTPEQCHKKYPKVIR